MADNEFNPTAVLGGYLKETDPDGAVKLARELCGQLEGDPDFFHGGVWPGNVDLDVDGKAVLGPPIRTAAAQRPADQVEYTAPEFFWDGETSAAADVYSVGLMLYAGCNGGYLPFQPTTGELTDKDRSNALRRRMKGEAVTAPEGVSDELKRVIEKALAYDPDARYITARELLTALGRTDEALPAAPGAAAGSAAAAGAVAAGVVGAAVAAAAEPAPEPVPEVPVPPETTKAPEAAEMPENDLSLDDLFPEDAPAGEPTVKQTPEAEAETPAAGAEPQPEQTPAPEPEAGDGDGKTEKAAAAVSSAAVAAGAVGAAVAAGKAGQAGTARTAARRQAPAPRRQYTVQKDFERVPRAQRTKAAVPAAQKKRRRSRAIPVLCVLAAGAILGSVAYALMGGLRQERPVESDPFVPGVSLGGETAELPTVSPAVLTPVPSATPKPSARPTATPRPSGAPDATPGAGTGSGQTGTEEGSLHNNTIPGSTVTDNTGAVTGSGTGGGTSPASGTGSGGSGSTGGSGSGSTGGGSYGGTGSTGSTGGGSTGGSSGGGSGGSSSGSSGGGSNPGYTVESASGTVYLTGELVRVRSGPGTGYSIIGVTHKGDSLTRTGTVANGWTRVTYKGYTECFVSSQYLTTTDPSAAPTVTATPTPTATPAPTPTPPTAAKMESGTSYSEATAAADGADKLYAPTDEASYNAMMDAVKAYAAGDGSGVKYIWLGVKYTGTAWEPEGFYAGEDAQWSGEKPTEADANAQVYLKLDGSDWKYAFSTAGTIDGAAAGEVGYLTKPASP